MTTKIKTNEKPILFSTPLVQAILEGRKTQTRRIIKPDPEDWLRTGDREFRNVYADVWGPMAVNGSAAAIRSCDTIKCPYGQRGDELYVRETWKPLGQDPDDGEWTIEYKTGEKVRVGRLWPREEEEKEIDLSERLAEEYEEKGYMPWKPSIHMPRGASRIQLSVTDIRVERVQEISGMDAYAEGVEDDLPIGNNGIVKREIARDKFAELWDSINADRDEGQYAWESNPWVWVVEFEVKDVKGA